MKQKGPLSDVVQKAGLLFESDIRNKVPRTFSCKPCLHLIQVRGTFAAIQIMSIVYGVI